MREAALYLRISTHNQTLDSQKYRAKVMADQNNLIYVATFQDEYISGANTDRVGLKQLEEWVKLNPGKVIVVPELSRIDRSEDQLTRLTLKALCKANNVELISDVPKGQDEAINNLIEYIVGFGASSERKQIKQRMMAGKYSKIRSGNPLVSKVPYGFSYIRRTDFTPAKIVLNQEEADILKQIFSWYVDSGYSILKIAKTLTEKKILTRQGKKIWMRATIHQILRNSACYGDLIYGKHIHQHNGKRSKVVGIKDPKEWIHLKVPQIISKDLYDKAQVKLEQNKLLDPRNIKYEYLLSKLLICGDCGKKYQAYTNNSINRYYRCSSRDRLNEEGKSVPCRNRAFAAKFLEPHIWNWVKYFILNPNILKERMDKLDTAKKETIKHLKERIQFLENKLKGIDGKYKEFYNSFNEGIFSQEDLILYKQITEEKKNQYLSQLVENEDKLKQLEEAIGSQYKNFLDSYVKFKFTHKDLDDLPFERKQKETRNFIKSIIVLPEKGRYKVEFAIPYKSVTINLDKLDPRSFQNASGKFRELVQKKDPSVC